MKTTTTVNTFNVTKNRILGRLSQCTDLEQLRNQLTTEAQQITPVVTGLANRAALIGHDISEGITAANQALDGDPEALDTL